MNFLSLLEQIQKLMILKGENSFKIKAFQNALEVLSDYKDLENRIQNKTLIELPGIGKGISDVLTEFFEKGYSTVLEDLKKAVPQIMIELTEIQGIGPKKAKDLVEKLEIQSLSDLEYACKENRLLTLKGFGLKAQTKILDSILFHQSNLGFLKINESFLQATDLLKEISQTLPKDSFELVQDVARKSEICKSIEFLVQGSHHLEIAKKILFKWVQEQDTNLKILPVVLHETSLDNFIFEKIRLSSSSIHWEKLQENIQFQSLKNSKIIQSENQFYKHLGYPFIPAECRDSGEELELAHNHSKYFQELISEKKIKGIFHNHTNLSDGSNTLEEMVIAAKNLGYEYIGISDHSQSAYYANGLSLEDLKKQKKEIDQLQKIYPEIKIFWGIESDILGDGSLDYSDEILNEFDFVIGSIHSRFQMEKEEMTERILKAISNPYIHFLGHPTGRLLLGRKGYECDWEKIISTAAKFNVAIELNANPHRLDLDWRWGTMMRKYGVSTSIHPDAHHIEGLKDVKYGVWMARKALFQNSHVINTKSALEVSQWLKNKKKI